MARRVVVKVRIPAFLVEKLDKLTKEGFYGNRNEAVADGIRNLLERYKKAGKAGESGEALSDERCGEDGVH